MPHDDEIEIAPLKGPIKYRELQNLAGVTRPTFNKWLKMVPGLNRFKGQKIFSPAQAQAIIKHLDLQ